MPERILVLSVMALALANSPEGVGHTIQGDFQRTLGRSAGSSDVGSLVSAFSQGLLNEDLLAALLGSDEFFKKSTAT